MSSRIAPIVALSLAAAVVSAPAAASAKSKSKSKGGTVKVMTRNLYLGADIITLATAPDLDAFKVNAANIFGNVEATNFPVRAPALAKEITAFKPDLVGLQEAAVWKTGPAGDPAAATTVRYDFTKELLAALKKQGQTYTVVVKQQEFDFEAPTTTQDVRLTMNDVILKRKGTKVKTGAKNGGNYKEFFKVGTPAGLANVKRGWTSVDAKIGGRSFRFVNTHLEAYSGDIGRAQISQLIGSGGPLASSNRPSIVLGDFNSDPTDKTAAGDAYRLLVGSKFTDVFSKPVQTFGGNELLTNATPASDTSIDHIMYRPKKSFSVVNRKVVGNKPVRQEAPRWASDHFGVTATLRVK